MTETNRRQFLQSIACTAAGAAMLGNLPCTLAATPARRKMRFFLSAGAIGVKAGLTEALALAERHGFEAIEPRQDLLASLSDNQLQEFLAKMKAAAITWGTAGLPVQFRQDQGRFERDMSALLKFAEIMRKSGVTRVSTWISPCHNDLTYMHNFKLHVSRLREAAKVLADQNQKLGLEYVGTQSLRNSQKFPFLHTMAETKELIGEIGYDNVGFVLDSWHWWAAGESAAEILSLKSEQVVSVDLNDAPAGIPKEQQIDAQRELPGSTGIIDIAAFINALTKIDYDGPVRAEPFNKAVNDLDDDAACAATVAALKKVFELAAAKSI